MYKSISKISVLGCGWLGLPLAKKLKEQGYMVNGSTTEVTKLTILEQAGINAFNIFIDGTNSVVDPKFFHTDLLIINIPPQRIDTIEQVYPNQILSIMKFASEHKVKYLLFISSTSVYPSINCVVTEKDSIYPDKLSGRAIVKAELIVKEFTNISSAILRFGGLISNDRNPLHSITRKKVVVPANTPVNLIHRDDCIAIITGLIEQGKWGFTFNACAPEHPTRAEFYQGAAEKLNLPLPEFDYGADTFKIVDSSLLMKELNYTFKYPNPNRMY